MSRRQWNWAIGMTVFSVLLIAAVTVLNVVRVPYVSLSPGSVYSASDAIVVDAGVVGDGGLTLDNSASNLGFVTVGVSQKLSLWRFFFDSLDSRIEIFKEDIINRGGSRDEADRRNAELMQASQQSAVTLALEFLGLTEITLFPSIETLECIYPDVAGSGNSDNSDSDSDAPETTPFQVFLLGDVVQSANGVPVSKTADLLEVIDGLPAGETVVLEFRAAPSDSQEGSEPTAGANGSGSPQPADNSEAGSAPRETFTAEVALEVTRRLPAGGFHFNVTFPTIAASGDEAAATEQPPQNFTCQDQQSWFAYDAAERDLLDSVRLNTGSVSGPSAGLAFTLSVIDLLSEGDLTGDLGVVTTGIVNSYASIYPLKFLETDQPRPECQLNYGRVCSVGGVTQKATAVRHNGYNVFLVPEDGNDYSNAIAAAGDVIVVEVSTLHEAVTALTCLGGDHVSAGSNYYDSATPELPDCDSLL